MSSMEREIECQNCGLWKRVVYYWSSPEYWDDPGIPVCVACHEQIKGRKPARKAGRLGMVHARKRWLSTSSRIIPTHLRHGD